MTSCYAKSSRQSAVLWPRSVSQWPLARLIQLPGQGRIQVGVDEARSRNKTRLSHSAQPAGRAQPTQRTLQWAYILYTNVATWPICVSIYYHPIPVSQKTIDFATQVWAIAVVFLIPQEILSSYHFFHLNSSYCRSPTFITLYFRSSLSSLWLQKGMASPPGARSAQRRRSQPAFIMFMIMKLVSVYGLTSSPVRHWRKGHGYLLLISTDQAHKSRLSRDGMDFEILTDSFESMVIHTMFHYS